jgi:hypothetical protein
MTQFLIALHTTILDKNNTYVRRLFIDYSSEFKTIVPSKLRTLGLNPSLCNWILEFLMGNPPGGKGRQQHICHADPQHWGPSGLCA